MTEMKTAIFPVSDLEKAKAMFSALLGTEPDMDSPYYVAFNVEGQQVGLNPNGHSEGFTGGVCYWHVDDIEAHLSKLLSAGAEVFTAARDVGGGRLVAAVKDWDGNVIGLIQDT